MHFTKSLLSIAALVAILCVGHASASAQEKPTTDSAIDAIVQQQMSEAGIVGLGAAIIVNKKVVWSKGYGLADKRNAVPFTPDTMMNIGSISKAFTGVALMRAVQDGKLSLDEDINRYLPFKVVNPNFPDERITLRQLATHTSSIIDRWSVYEASYNYGGDSPEKLGDFLASYFTTDGKTYSKDNFLGVKPGANYEYSNIGAGLAGYVVELAVRENLSSYTKRHIFTPLKMNNTAWFLSDITLAKHSKLYIAQGGITVPIQLYGLPTYPDGGVRTSVADLSKLFIAMLNDGEFDGARILDKRMVDEMTRLQFTDAKKPENIVLAEKNSGLFWQTKYNVTRFGHGGSDPGVKTDMLSSRDKDVAVVVFSNTSLCDQDMKLYGVIFNTLWKHAESLKSATH